MSTSVRFCLPYDPIKWDFIGLKMNIILIKKHIDDTIIASDVSCMCQNVATPYI